MNKRYEKETICVQSGWQPKNGEPRVLPIYQSTTFKYETSEQMGRLLDFAVSYKNSPLPPNQTIFPSALMYHT